MIFEQEPRFVDLDNRKNRKTYQISNELLEKKHKAIFNNIDLSNKTVLDIGSCLGASGFWCLKNGAKHYTGIEVQNNYCELSNMILHDHFDNEKFLIINDDALSFIKQSSIKYDIVIACGVIYAFLDIFEILREISSISNDVLIIESFYPTNMKHKMDSIIQIKNGMMNLSDIDAGTVADVSFPSPIAIYKILKKNGFILNREITVDKIHDVFDVYNTMVKINDFNLSRRFILEFKRTNIYELDCSQQLIDKKYNKESYINVENKYGDLLDDNKNKWSFEDPLIVKSFQKIAHTNIPNYEKVIDKCISLAKKYLDKNAKIIDVGSSLNYTLLKFYNSGYKNLYGVEKSKEMIQNAVKIPNIDIINSEVFPKNESFDMIIANWVLHFIDDRRKYLSDIFNSLNDNGIFILSEKIHTDNNIIDLYHDFKRSMGVTEEEIKNKHNMLKGVLVTYPLEWYIDVLREIGFKDLTIIDSEFCFVTILAKK